MHLYLSCIIIYIVAEEREATEVGLGVGVWRVGDNLPYLRSIDRGLYKF